MPARHRALALLLLCALACDKEGEEASASGPSWPGASAADIARSLESVPEGAVAVAVLSVPRPFWALLLDSSMVPMSAEARGAMDRDLRSVLGGQLGLDLTKTRAATGFALFPAGGAAVFRDVGGSLKGASGDVPVVLDGELVAGHRKDALAVGLDPAVRAALEVAGGKARSLAAARPDLARWIAEQGTGTWVVVAGSPKGMPVPAPFSQIERVALAIGPRRTRLVAEGDPAALQQLARQIEAGLAMVVAQLDDMKSAALKGETPAALAAVSVYQYHQMKNLAAQVRPRVSGNRLTIEAPVDFSDSGMVYVALVGVLAAVAIPAFMKYIKKSKSSEARTMLMGLRARVEDHLLEHRALPPPAGPTPPLGTCCKADPEDAKCPPDPAAWAAPTWRALDFSMDDPHYYSYELAVDGDRYILKAWGDLDCDGIYSTFTLSSDQPSVVENDPLE